MQKKRLIRAQQHPATNQLVDYLTNNKTFKIEDVDHYHREIHQLVNEASDQAYAVTQLTKGNSKLFEYYNAVYQKLDQLSNSLENMNPSHST